MTSKGSTMSHVWLHAVVPLLTLLATVVPVRGQKDAPPVEAQTASLAYGLQVYKQYYCGICHQLDTAGTQGAFGPSHNEAGDKAVERLQDPNYQGEAKTAEAYIRESILEPQVYIVPGYAATPHRMPAYTQLTQEEFDALVAFLMH